MKITIHRGAEQIGGCITQISSHHCSILIDLGSNLPGSIHSEYTPENIKEICNDVDAVFYTHYHGDHVGLMSYVPSHCQQYMGEGALKVMKCKFKIVDEKLLPILDNVNPYYTARTIDVADKHEIYITPYFVSHSAFDSYMFKIECEGKTILHTGDFRSHGYLGKGLFPTIQKYIGQVDILITEGTMLGRLKENVLNENDIKLNTINLLKKHKYVYALCSSTDIDRMASFHAACNATGRKLYIDDYQQQVLQIFTDYAGTYSDLFKFDNLYSRRDFYSTEVRSELKERGFLRLIRTWNGDLVNKMLRIYHEEPSWLIYSMWGGYAEQGKRYSNENIIAIRSLFGDRIADGTKDGFHTSGHADVTTLRKVCQMVSPRLGVIPIHKEADSDAERITQNNIRIYGKGISVQDGVEIEIK